MNASRANTWAAAAAMAVVWTFLPAIASAQESAKWYTQSEQQFLELKQKAGGGTRLTWGKLPDWTGIFGSESQALVE